MLRTSVGKALAGIILGGAVYGVVAIVKILDEGISKGCRTIGRQLGSETDDRY